MENRELEILECRQEIRELRTRLDRLNARVEALDGNAPAQPAVTVSSVPLRETAPAACGPAQEKTEGNLENTVGRNLFAVLASVLVLIGVGVFISTIYEYIPQIVKIGAIYLFGFGLLGAGLALYRKNGNKFWLGVASCGLAELLVSVITSHSYFGVLSLTGTFVLVLVWILGSFWLTRFHPSVFKTIGYVGFLISMILGLDLLRGRDTVIYLTLLGAYVILSVFFMVSHKKYVTMNTLMAFGSIVGLCMFLGLHAYLPENWDRVSGLAAMGILTVFHGVYVRKAKLSRNAYPLYALATTAVLLLFLLPEWTIEQILPILLGTVLALWFVGHRLEAGRGYRVFFLVFAAVFPAVLALYGNGWPFFAWYPVFAAAAYGLYFLTRSREAAWMGLAWFLGFWRFAGGGSWELHLAVFAAAAAAFAAIRAGWLRKDSALETAWYAVLFWIAHSLRDDLWLQNPDGWSTVNAVFYALMAVVNTGYLHLVTRDRERIMKVTGRGVAVMALQVYLFFANMSGVGSARWLVSLLGVASSLLILSHSLWYTYKTKGRNRGLMVWQFVKFSLYCAAVLTLLDSPSILINIALLLIAVGAVGVGFRLGHKSVRVYGLALSLLDVVSLVLFNIDYSDSLQLAGGIILCGGLCFVISFIYSRISKMTKQEG